MSLLDRIAANNAKNVVVNQVPNVSNVNSAPVTGAKTIKITPADFDALLNAALAKGVAIGKNEVSANQNPIMTAAPAQPVQTVIVPPVAPITLEPVYLTHEEAYPAGTNKQTGKPYDASANWYAVAMPSNMKRYKQRGLTPDGIYHMLKQYPDYAVLRKEHERFFEKWGTTSHTYKESLIPKTQL